MRCSWPCITAHQNRSALKRKLRHWRAWTRLLASAAWTITGACQSHNTIAFTHHATSGSVTPRQALCKGAALPSRSTVSRQAAGSAHRNGNSGRLSASSGAATTISSSCWTMRAEKSPSPKRCGGGASASARTSQPLQNDSLSERLILPLAPAPRQYIIALRPRMIANSQLGLEKAFFVSALSTSSETRHPIQSHTDSSMHPCARS